MVTITYTSGTPQWTRRAILTRRTECGSLLSGQGVPTCKRICQPAGRGNAHLHLGIAATGTWRGILPLEHFDLEMQVLGFRRRLVPLAPARIKLIQRLRHQDQFHPFHPANGFPKLPGGVVFPRYTKIWHFSIPCSRRRSRQACARCLPIPCRLWDERTARWWR